MFSKSSEAQLVPPKSVQVRVPGETGNILEGETL